MNYSWDEIYRLIQRADQLDAGGRLTIFEFLAQKLSLIPLRDGFPTPAEIEECGSLAKAAKKYKGPVEKGWERWCQEKRPFIRANCSTDRAGVACGPASGVLVLDVDDMGRFWEVLKFNGIEQTLPPTFAVKTGGRGDRYHYYFKYPTDGKKYSNRSKAGCFDVRGVGGQVICPGSLHPETTKPYLVATNEDILDAPKWLLEYASRSREIFTKEEYERAPKKSFPNTTRADISDIELSETINGEMDFFIANLPVSDDVKQKIMTQYALGSRSEASWSVLLGLLNAKVDEKTIRRIYDHYPIGDKSRQEPEWFEREIEAAKKTIARNPIGSAMQNSPVSPSSSASTHSDYFVMNAFDVVFAQTNFEFLIENFWPKDEPLLITGYGGAGKSVLTLQVAMDLVFPPVNGFLDKFKVVHDNHRVLFVQSENSLVAMKRRFEVIRSAYSITDDIIRERLFFLGRKDDILPADDLSSPSFQDVIGNFHRTYQFDILVVDPLISFHKRDENSNNEMRELLDDFSGFCKSLNVSPLIIHHHGKFKAERGIGGGRGASAIGDWSPNTWELEYKEKDKKFKFIHKKARDFMLNETLDLQMVNLRFAPLTSPGQSAQSFSQIPKNIACVIKAITNLGGHVKTQGELKTEVVKVFNAIDPGEQIKPATARNYILAAVRGGHIKEVATGGYSL
jgi:archaellum biogenesis ATPase FlaH